MGDESIRCDKERIYRYYSAWTSGWANQVFDTEDTSSNPRAPQLFISIYPIELKRVSLVRWVRINSAEY